jgi:hypothetical protein
MIIVSNKTINIIDLTDNIGEIQQTLPCTGTTIVL